MKDSERIERMHRNLSISHGRLSRGEISQEFYDTLKADVRAREAEILREGRKKKRRYGYEEKGN